MSDRNALVARLIPFLLLRRYEPGERVPSERELAERFKVSRGQIREALSYLEALRMIERRAKSGIYMASEAASIEALALYAQLGIPLTPEDVRQSVEMRRIHEIAAIRLACERRTPENIARMREILAIEGERVVEHESIAESDREFHSEIVRSTQNSVFFRIVNIFYIMTEAQRAVYFQSPRRGQMSHEEHLLMFDAIERQDTYRAMDLMTAHLKGVDSYWQDLMDRDAAQLAARAATPSRAEF